MFSQFHSLKWVLFGNSALHVALIAYEPILFSRAASVSCLTRLACFRSASTCCALIAGLPHTWLTLANSSHSSTRLGVFTLRSASIFSAVLTKFATDWSACSIAASVFNRDVLWSAESLDQCACNLNRAVIVSGASACLVWRRSAQSIASCSLPEQDRMEIKWPYQVYLPWTNRYFIAAPYNSQF